MTGRTHGRSTVGRVGRVTGAVLALVVGAAGLVVTVAAPARAAGGVVEIDPTARYQTIQGWGTSLAWWAEGSGGWSSTTARNALADALFSPTTGLGLNVVRYNLGATTPTDRCAAQMRVGGAVPSFEQSAGVYDWSQDPNQRWMLQAAKARGADVFEATAYSAPDWMTLNHCSAGADTAGADNLPSSQYQAYAQYLATVVGRFRTTWGIPFTTVEPFNEPVGTAWNSTVAQQGMNVSTAAQDTIVGDLHAQLAAAGLAGQVDISAPDEFSSARTVSDYDAYSAASKADVAQVNTHDYAGGDGSGVATIGKRSWMSEWGRSADSATASQMTEGVDLSRQILTNEQQMRPTAWVAWQAVDGPLDGGNINDLWGLVWADYSPSGSGQLTFPKRYYVMGNYSKFVRPGAQVIANNDPDTFTTYDPASGNLVIVATNPTSAPESERYDLARFSVAPQASAAGYQTSATQDLATLPATPLTSAGLSVTLPAQSVTTYVVPAAPAGARSATVTTNGTQLQVYGRTADGSVSADVYTPGTSWSGWTSLGGSTTGTPGAVRHGGRTEVFGRSPAGTVTSAASTPGGGWSGWQDLGGNSTGNPVAVDYDTAQQGDQVAVFGRAGDGSVSWDVEAPGGGWSGWRNIGGDLADTPTAIQDGSQLKLFGRTTDGSTWTSTYNPGGSWSAWQSLGGSLTGTAFAVQYGDQLELYGRAPDGSTWSKVSTPGGTWSSWQSLGGNLAGSPVVAAYDSAQYGVQLEVYGRAADGSTWSRVYTPGSGWSSWYSLGGVLAGDPTAVQYTTPRYGVQLEVYGRSSGGSVWVDVYTQGGSWSGWQSLGGSLVT